MLVGARVTVLKRAQDSRHCMHARTHACIHGCIAVLLGFLNQNKLLVRRELVIDDVIVNINIALNPVSTFTTPRPPNRTAAKNARRLCVCARSQTDM